VNETNLEEEGEVELVAIGNGKGRERKTYILITVNPNIVYETAKRLRDYI
jgi:hypothetical protein